MTYLVDHPTDFRGAFARIRRELRSLYFSAFQSHLWNLTLARVIEHLTRPEQRIAIDFKVASLPIHHGLDTVQAATSIGLRVPLPASRTTLAPTGLERTAALEVVAENGLAWEDLRVKHLKDVFFSKGDRPALFFASGFVHQISPDELHVGRKKLRLKFELPKGAYATMVVKRLTEINGPVGQLSPDARYPLRRQPLPRREQTRRPPHPGRRDRRPFPRGPCRSLSQGKVQQTRQCLRRARAPTRSPDLRCRRSRATSKAASRLAAQFRDGQVQKIYWAIVEGSCPTEAGEWADTLLKDEQRNVVEVVPPGTPRGREATLSYRVLNRFGRSCWLEIRPVTGRSHQIRVQLAARGLPVVGDRKYGAISTLMAGDGKPRVALHARSLSFKHPTREEVIALTAEVPGDWPGPRL